MSDARPICELLQEALNRMSKVNLSGGGGVNALVIAYQLTGRKELLDRAVQEADRLAAILFEGGEIGETLPVVAHAFRAVMQAGGGGKSKEALERLTGYVLKANPVDAQLFQAVMECYWATGREELLLKMKSTVDAFSGEDKVKGLFALYGATKDKTFFEAALRELKNGANAALMCWEVCGFEVDFYPEDAEARRLIFKELKLDRAEDLWKFVSAIRGELKLREKERRTLVDNPLSVGAPVRVLMDPVGEGVVLGRTRDLLERVGCKGLAYIGCVGEEGELLGHPVLLDVLKPHVIFICGQRGSGKSYTMGVLAEELVSSGIGVAVILVDPVGVFWSMKEPNTDEGEVTELEKWGMKARGFSNVNVFVPLGVYWKLPESTRDAPFSIKPSDLTVEDWCYVFGVERFSPSGLLLEKALLQVRDGYRATTEKGEVEVKGKGDEYTLDDLIRCIETSSELLSRERGFRADTRRAIVSRLLAAKEWGIFSREGTPIEEVAKPDTVSVIDVSHLASELRSLVVGLLARKVLERRMQQARIEEAGGDSGKVAVPVTWLMVDEAHVLAPARGETAASKPLVEYAKLGRKPGCALVLATQQPSAISDQILSQVDVMVVHRLVFESDIDAFMRRAPNSVPNELAREEFVRGLPAGMALVSDGSVETGRTIVVKIRPKLSRHAGREATPSPVEAKVRDVEEIDKETVGAVNGLKVVEEVEGSTVHAEKLSILNLPQEIAFDYLSRLLKYRFHEFLYPSHRETVSFQKVVKLDPKRLLGFLRERLSSQGWALSEREGEVFIILAEKEGVRMGVTLALSEVGVLVAVEITAPSKEATVKIKESVISALNVKEDGWVPPAPLKQRPVQHYPSLEESVVEVRAEEAVTPPPEKTENYVRFEDEIGGGGLSPEDVIAKIQRIQKYLQSLHEYYSLGKIAEEEYLFLKRKALRKIEELKSMLSGN